MSGKLKEKIDLKVIRYANCWEDATVLLKGLDLEPSKKILSIASAGDNSFSLLTTDPEIVVAVDISSTQLHVVELKKAAIFKWDREEVLSFLGFTSSNDRLRKFQELTALLPDSSRIFWENNLHLIEQGIIHQGKFEKYFQFFAKRVLPLIHRRSKVEQLLAQKSEAEQEHFYASQWNTWRWRLLFKIFFSKWVMGSKGRDPEFLKHVEVSVSDYIFTKAERELKNTKAQNNFILRYNLTGNFGELLPHYLQEENFKSIKARLDRLITYEGYVEHAAEQFGPFDAMNLSDIFEYMSPDHFHEMGNRLHRGMKPNGKIAYWNLMVLRQLSQTCPDYFEFMERSRELSKNDHGFFYQRFIIDQVKSL